MADPPDPTQLSPGILILAQAGEGLTLTGSSGLTIKKLT